MSIEDRNPESVRVGVPPPLSVAATDVGSEVGRSVLELSHDCVKILDSEARLLFMNINGQCIMEIDDFGALKGTPWPAVWPEAEREKVRKAVEYALTVGVAHFTAQCPTAKGSMKWWDVVVTALPQVGGTPPRLLSVSRDITAQKDAEAALRRSYERLDLIAAATNDVLWEIDLVTHQVWWSEGMQSVFGYGKDVVGPDTAWCAEHIHPDDRKRVFDGMQAACDRGDAIWSDKFRYLRSNGVYAYVNDRGLIVRDDAGKATRMVGAMQDITEQVKTDEIQQVLVREMAHRANNALTVVHALVQQSARTAVDPQEFAKGLIGRITAMVRANRSLVDGSNLGAADLRALLDAQLEAFLGDGTRVRLDGPTVKLRGTAASAFALLIHELATNSVKHGALSRDTGRVDLSWSTSSSDGGVRLTMAWTESGGPPVSEPSRRGFGTILMERGLAGGSVERIFRPAGLVCKIELPLS